MSPVAEDVSVVICSRERAEMLGDTVRSLLAGETLPRELVVVDQSKSVHEEIANLADVDGCRVLYIHSDTTGLSRARNVGLRAASGAVAVMIDDDMLVERDWLTELLAGRPAGERGVATGRVLAAPPEGRAGVVPPAALVESTTPATYRGPQPMDVVPGAGVALPRELVLELGGYDERLGAGTRFAAADDNDMGHRLLRAGCAVRHVPAAVVYHRAWRTRGELVRLRWAYGRGKGAFYAKHALSGDRFVARRALADLTDRLRALPLGLLRAPKAAAADLIYMAGIGAAAIEWTLRARLASLRGGGR